MKNVPYFVISGLVVIIIIFIMRDCSRPSEEKEAERKQQFETEVAILKQDKRAIQAAQDSLILKAQSTSRKDSIQLAAQSARIKALQTKLTNQRPKVIERIQADTAVLSYVNTLEEVVGELQVQVDTLKSQARFQRKINEDLITQENIEDKIEASMQIETTRRIAELEQQGRKKERRSKLKGILVPVALIGGLLFGSSL